MGLLTETERQEFEHLCAQYPEIVTARTAFELSLEEQLLADGKQPPVQLKQQIQDRLSTASTEHDTEEIEEERPVRSIGLWKWLAAASLLLLAGAAYWAFSTNQKNQDLRAQNSSLQDSLHNLEAQLATLQPGGSDGPQSEFRMAAIRQGEAAATIYWDTLTKDVYLKINNMPAPASGKQYQLWALLPEEGAAPVDLGVFDIRQERTLIRMKNVRDAKAFAITLEPKGGVPKPTGAPMVSTEPKNL
jgi:anti-sigma-K factor RskA